MLRGAKMICLAAIDWDFNWQLPQEVATAFADSGNEVLFIENTGVRRPGVKDLPRLWKRWKRWWHAHGDAQPERDHVRVFSPLLLPLPYSRPAIFLNAAILLRVIRRWRGANASEPLIVVTFLPTPLVQSVIRGLRPALVVYYAMDHLAQSSPGAHELETFERRLLEDADLVLATGNRLRKSATEFAKRVELLVSGVRSHDFRRARDSDEPAPAVFGSIAGRIVGFVGSIRNELDLGMIRDAAALAPDLTFVFVGPVVANVRALAELPNVRLIGPVAHDEVMRYMVRFDAGIAPYVLNEYTASILPAKLPEYLAAGLPVVATPLPEVCRFAEKHPGVITFANNASELVAALRAAIASNDADKIAQRMKIAQGYEWSTQMAAMSNFMEALLIEKSA